MGISVSYGDDNTLNMFLYGEKAPGTMSYLNNQINALDTYSTILNDSGRSFMSDARQIYDSYNGHEAMRIARMALNKADNIFNRNDIHFISDVCKLQAAPLAMSRWIMAEPTVRELYHNQRCDGYASGTVNNYIDMDPDVIGDKHYDYRRVMNGIVTSDEDGDDKVTFYLDELRDGDRELHLEEKVAILNTWEVVADLMRYGKDDVTNPLGGNL